MKIGQQPKKKKKTLLILIDHLLRKLRIWIWIWIRIRKTQRKGESLLNSNYFLLFDEYSLIREMVLSCKKRKFSALAEGHL